MSDVCVLSNQGLLIREVLSTLLRKHSICDTWKLLQVCRDWQEIQLGSKAACPDLKVGQKVIHNGDVQLIVGLAWEGRAVVLWNGKERSVVEGIEITKRTEKPLIFDKNEMYYVTCIHGSPMLVKGCRSIGDVTVPYVAIWSEDGDFYSPQELSDPRGKELMVSLLNTKPGDKFFFHEEPSIIARDIFFDQRHVDVWNHHFGYTAATQACTVSGSSMTRGVRDHTSLKGFRTIEACPSEPCFITQGIVILPGQYVVVMGKGFPIFQVLETSEIGFNVVPVLLDRGYTISPQTLQTLRFCFGSTPPIASVHDRSEDAILYSETRYEMMQKSIHNIRPGDLIMPNKRLFWTAPSFHHVVKMGKHKNTVRIIDINTTDLPLQEVIDVKIFPDIETVHLGLISPLVVGDIISFSDSEGQEYHGARIDRIFHKGIVLNGIYHATETIQALCIIKRVPRQKKTVFAP